MTTQPEHRASESVEPAATAAKVPSRTAPAFTVRHIQLMRALFAAIAAVMITFSPDHSAAVGLAVFSGFAIATALVLLLGSWLVYPKGRRWPWLLSGSVTAVAGMAASMYPVRTVLGFFVVMVSWALVAGLIEALSGWWMLRHDVTRGEMPRSEARDAIVVGALGVVLAIALLLVPAGYALPYTVAEADQTFVLTGIIIGVGLFGGYAAIVAVYLGIAGFSPRTDPQVDAADQSDAGAPAGRAATEPPTTERKDLA
ncbi:hypothetical protein GCM10022200_21630 [Microbacterium awajiense]|uniref:Acyl-CoA synthetase n=1 Tax=Microbacterium awajiense TaxID=415214 RepID=A0ABP7AR37_9MICO